MSTFSAIGLYVDIINCFIEILRALTSRN